MKKLYSDPAREGKLGEHRSGELRLETEEAKAERLLADELGRLGWNEGDLLLRLKNDLVKLEIAARVRRETTLPIKAIARRLRLGTSKGAKARLHAAMKGAGPEDPARGRLRQ